MSEKGPKFANLCRIWLNFGFKKVIYWLRHSVPIKSSTVIIKSYFTGNN